MMRDGDTVAMRTVPLAGVLSQGSPIDESVLPEEATVPADQIDADDFVLRVEGTALRGLGIEPADLLIIEPRPDGHAATGELVLAKVGERAFLGRWWTKQGRRALMDAEIRPTTESKELRVVGTVTAIVRWGTGGGRRRH